MLLRVVALMMHFLPMSVWAIEIETCTREAPYCFAPNEKDEDKIAKMKSVEDIKDYYSFKIGQVQANVRDLANILREHRDVIKDPSYSTWIGPLGNCIPQYNVTRKLWVGNIDAFGSNAGQNSFEKCLAFVPQLPQDIRQKVRQLNYQASAVRHSPDLCKTLGDQGWCKHHAGRVVDALRHNVADLYVRFAQPATDKISDRDKVETALEPDTTKSPDVTDMVHFRKAVIKILKKSYFEESLFKSGDYIKKFKNTKNLNDAIINLFEKSNGFKKENLEHIQRMLQERETSHQQNGERIKVQEGSSALE